MTAYNAKHPYEPDWQIPLGVWANVVNRVCLPWCLFWSKSFQPGLKWAT